MSLKTHPFSAYEGKRVLVTGASGYIGGVLLGALSGTRCQITAFSRPSATRVPESRPHSDIVWVEGDLTQAEFWPEILAGQDIVFHLAAQTSYAQANANPTQDWQKSVGPVLHLLRACEAARLRPRIVFGSTATVAGMTNVLPVDEKVLPKPFTIYDVHKLASETYLEFYYRQTLIPTVSLRLANVYGPSPGQSKEDRGVLNKMAHLALEGKNLSVYGTGEWVRDYIHISDVVTAFLSAGVATEQKVAGQVFNVSSGEGTRFVDAVRWVGASAAQKTGRAVKVNHIEPEKRSAIDERSYIGDNRALIKATGWLPCIDLRIGIEEMVSHFFERSKTMKSDLRG